jgi:hypothetical protein
MTRSVRSHNVITYIGSVAAMVGGLGTTLYAQAAPPSEATNNYSLAGLIAALSGLTAAIFPQLQLGIRLWIEDRRQDREAKLGRDKVENQLRVAQLQIDELRQSERELGVVLKYNREMVASFARKLGVDLPPLPEIPDRHPTPADPPPMVTEAGETPPE